MTVVICPHLEVTARSVVPDARVVLIENAPGSGDVPVAGSGKAIRESLGIDASAPMVLYTGTFEAYQGLDLLFASAKIVHARRVPTRASCSRAANPIRWRARKRRRPRPAPAA